MNCKISTELNECSPCRSARLNSLVTNQVTSRYTNMPFDTDTSAFIADAMCLSRIAGCDPRTVVKKIPSATPEKVHAATAQDFLDAEVVCSKSNIVFSGVIPEESDCYDLESLVTLFDPENIAQTADSLLSAGGKAVVDRAVTLLNRIITLDFRAADAMSLGPGVSQCSSFRSRHIIDKLDHGLMVAPNPDFWPGDYYEPDLASHMLERMDLSTYTVDIIQQVPKKADRNRTIGITDMVALSAQGVVSDYMQACMCRHGLDIRSLSDKHRDLAAVGSLHGGLATLDFSMASDTLSIGLVWILLNNNRSTVLCRNLYRRLWGCRTWSYNLDETEGIYQKFSPMGNKATFPLETLLFTVITRAICDVLRIVDPNGRKPTSFGDDVILYGPDLILDRMKATITNRYSELGLLLNIEKSFFTGPFRESCGADYLDGRFVRGFYHKKLTVTLQDVVRCVNHFTLYYGITLYTILHHCPYISSVFRAHRLDRVCYSKLAFVDQLAHHSLHDFAAIDTFIVCSEMDIRELGLRGIMLLSYSSPNILTYSLEYRYVKGIRTQYRRYAFDGKRERFLRKKLLQRLSEVGEMDLLYNYIGTGQGVHNVPRKLSEVLDQNLGIKTPIAWVVPETISSKVRMRAYNPAWPLELPIRTVNWL